ncbi:MAG: hypothetical protein JWR88_1864, partial [Pseudonocardia sp.]|nr:hypothetical protein [Pseudonocardia sp.]
MSPLDLISLGVATMLGLVAKKAIELILEKEYTSWATALARLLVKLAGFAYRPRRREWLGDLIYLQQVEKKSGLAQAISCLTS